MSDPRDETRRFNLGTILTRMRAVTREDLAEALDAQARMSNGDRLGIGELLIRRGKLTGEQLEEALTAQMRLRSPDKRVRAEAAVRLAKVSGQRVVQFCQSIRASSAEIPVAKLSAESG